MWMLFRWTSRQPYIALFKEFEDVPKMALELSDGLVLQVGTLSGSCHR
jgi:hypothetical protein